jgi:Pyridoxamine 5'-phosphate oxidase
MLVAQRKSGYLTSVALGTAMPEARPESGSTPLYGTQMPYILNGQGTPVFGLSESSQHVVNLERYNRLSMVVWALTPLNVNPSKMHMIPRVNLTGRGLLIGDVGERQEAVDRYCARHPAAAEHGARSFRYYTLDVDAVVFGFNGATSDDNRHVDADAYQRAQVDLLAPHARTVIDHVNADERRLLLVALVSYYAEWDKPADDAFLYSVDTRGFNAMAQNADNKQWYSLRMPFPQSIDEPNAVIEAFHEASQHAVDQLKQKYQ